jgi:hypothetical protein
MARRGARMYIWRSPSHGCALSQNNMFQKQVSRQRDPRLPPRSTLHHHPAIAWFGCNSHVALTKPLSALTHAYSQQHLNTSPATPSRESSTPRLNMLPHALPPRHPEPDHPSPISTSYRLLVSRASTQRLHSPSLDIPPAHTTPQQQEEVGDRQKSRFSALQQLRDLGVSWGNTPYAHATHKPIINKALDRFVYDVRCAEQVVHVLGPTRYVPREAETRNARKDNARRQDRAEGMSGEDKERCVRQMQLLRTFGRARCAGWDGGGEGNLAGKGHVTG